MTETIKIGAWFQGPTGSGQGGWSAHRLARSIDEPVTVAIKRPIPLETELAVVPVADDWHLLNPDEPEEPILIATPWDPDFATTTAVPLADAAEARTRFPSHDDHPVPFCFSCGTSSDSMHVQSGSLGDGRWSSDWTVPAWAAGNDGVVDEGVLWAAIDCAQAWYVSNEGKRRPSVTVQLAVDVLAPLEPGATYALVSWHGTYSPEWDGRKRGAGGAVFTGDGTCVARSSSFWIGR